MARESVPVDVLELADILRPTWPALHAELVASGLPLCEGDADADGDAGDDADGDAGDADGSGDGDDKPAEKTAEELREELRKGDRTRKRESAAAKKRIADLEKQLKEREDADKSEQEKAVEKAREEGKAEALTASQKERRNDRLEVAVTRQATRGVTVGDGDDERTFKFADPEDVLDRLERKIAKGDIDADEIFDDEHRVRDEALTEALVEIAQERPRWEAGSDNGSDRPSGDAGARKGKSGGKSEDERSIDEHLTSIRRTK